MVDILSMVDLTSISAMLAALGVTVGVVFAILQLRDLVRTRQTDLVLRLYSTFGSQEWQEAWFKVRAMELEDYNAFMKKHGWSGAMNEVSTLFEGIGVLLYRKLIDISLVEDLLSGPVKRTWEKMKPVMEGTRKQYNDPQLYEWFEYLYNELQKYRVQKLQQTQQ